MSELFVNRREAVAGLVAATALPLFSGPAFAQAASPSAEAEAIALLDSIAENLLWLSPESATTLGIDNGKRAPLRSRLSDRSGIGLTRAFQTIRADFARANAIDLAGLSHSIRTSIEVVRL